MRTRSPSASPRAPASSGCISSFTSGRGSSPSVELIVRSLAGEMSASGYALGRRVGLEAVEPHRRRGVELVAEQVHLAVRRVREDVDELNRRRRRRAAPGWRPSRISSPIVPGRSSSTRTSRSSSPARLAVARAGRAARTARRTRRRSSRDSPTASTTGRGRDRGGSARTPSRSRSPRGTSLPAARRRRRAPCRSSPDRRRR